MSRDIAHLQWRFSIVSISTWCLGHNMSESVCDRDLDPIDHQYEMTYWDSNSHVNDHITWPTRSRSIYPQYIWAHYLDNGWRYGLGAYGAPIGNGYLGIKWSRDRWRHVTLKGQRRNPNMLRAHYLENGWRYRLGSNGPRIGNGLLGFEWSRSTSAYSALEVLHIMRYINLLTYLLTYLWQVEWSRDPERSSS